MDLRTRTSRQRRRLSERTTNRKKNGQKDRAGMPNYRTVMQNDVMLLVKWVS